MLNTKIKDYHILSELGQGGMATVFLAHDSKFDTNVAIKVLNKEFVHNDNIRKRFLAEARNMYKMSHANIIKVTDLIEEGDTVAFVMEYIEGETLKSYIDRKGKLSDEEIKNLFTQMLDALGYVHEQSLVHRDIKPSNFMLDKKGKIKLMDFGIAKNIDQNAAEYTQTGTGLQMGTPMYMSPEQVKSTKEVTFSTDIYSIGVVLWQMAAGRKPYDIGELSIPEIQVSILKEPLTILGSIWDGIIQKSTEKNMDNRFKNCVDFKSVFLNGDLKINNTNFADNHETTIFENKTANEISENTVIEDLQIGIKDIDSLEFDGKKVTKDIVNGFVVTKIDEKDEIKYGVVDIKGNWILHPKYDDITLQFIDGHIYYLIEEEVEISWMKTESRWSLLKKDSLERIYTLPCHSIHFYDKFGYCTASISKIKLFDSETLYGKIDINGNWIIQPIYDYLGDFDKNGLCAFNIGSKIGLLNLKGDTNFFRDFDWIHGLDELGYHVSVRDKVGVVNQLGDWIIQPIFASINEFNGKLQAVATDKNSKSGVINQKGEWLIKPLYDSLSWIKGTDFWVAPKKGKEGVIDINENWVIPPKFDNLYFDKEYENDNLIAQFNDGVGIVDLNGNWLVEPKFLLIDPIRGVKGLYYAALKEYKYGIIDIEGKWVIDPKFDYDIWMPL